MYPIGLARRDGRRNAAPGEFGQLERTTLESSPDADQRSVHEGDWVRVELHMVDQEAEVVLLRPVEWLALEGAAIGGQVGIHLPELGLSGPATVESIAAWAASAEATATAGGHPVTGLIRRTVPGYERLSLSSGEVLEVTGAHRVWSLDQGAWTEAAHLELGERLAGRAGPVTLVGRDLVPECTRVYNLEVQGTHTFRVGGDGVWVHNDCREAASKGAGMTPDQQALKELVDEASLGGRKPLTREDAEAVMDWADEANYPGARAKPNVVTGNHPGASWDGKPHIHIPGAGRGGHVPVEPGVKPR